MINVIMSEYIDINSFQRAFCWLQGNEGLTWLSRLIISTLGTILNFLCMYRSNYWARILFLLFDVVYLKFKYFLCEVSQVYTSSL